MEDASPIRIMIADDHPVVRQGLAVLLNRRPDMEVVAQASNGTEAVAQFALYHPDISLMDIRMPEMDGPDAITAIRALAPSARLIVLTTYDDEEDILRGLRAGAKAYMLKGAPREELLACIRAVRAGQSLIPPAFAARLSAQ